MNNTGTLYLIPTIIAPDTHHRVLSQQLLATLPAINEFLVENVRTARRYLSSLKLYPSIDTLQFHVLDKDTTPQEVNERCAPLLKGLSMGVLSESGCPGVADPGAMAVAFAHEHGIHVTPLVGPSSILLALMASGLNGQRFAFHGYLPVDAAVTPAIRELEKESRKKNQTQIIIETPYRNQSVFNHLIKTLDATTLLTVACDVTGESERILTLPVGKWRLHPWTIGKIPAVFLFLA